MYPLKFEDILRPMIWGGEEISRFKQLPEVHPGIGESWEISQVGDRISVVSEGEDKGKTITELIKRDGANLLGKHVAARYADKFPLLIKFIDAHDNLSIQVHPNDELAMARHNSFGKTEMWYVIDAKPGAGLYSGFSKQITPAEYVERIKNNTITDVLQEYEIHPGDVFFLPAGRVHSIGAGSFIAEIQQTSDITYRIYDFNRKDANGKTRELHTDLAREAINYEVLDDYRTKYEPLKDEPVELVACTYFTTSLYDMTEEISCDYSELDSFVIFICMEGSCKMRDNEGNELTVSAGESILLPATTQDITITPEGGNVKLLETYV